MYLYSRENELLATHFGVNIDGTETIPQTQEKELYTDKLEREAQARADKLSKEKKMKNN